jgi:hypothetical protein
MFLELCEESLALGEKGSIFAIMKSELPKEVTDEELHVDAYSFMRGGELILSMIFCQRRNGLY